ncbi:MAG: hypothetical protein HC822_02095 [Oscillochloris sp.]|nr:hypothetical protein [Oscillochloris sp.]
METIPLREGTVIDAGCRTCGTLNPAQALFCMRCGSRLSSPSRPGLRPYLLVGGAALILGLLALTRTPALFRLTPMFLSGLLLIGMAFVVARLFSSGQIIPALFVLFWSLGIPLLLIGPLPLRLPILLVLLGLSVLTYVVARTRQP